MTVCTTPCVFGCDLVYSGITFLTEPEEEAEDGFEGWFANNTEVASLARRDVADAQASILAAFATQTPDQPLLERFVFLATTR